MITHINTSLASSQIGGKVELQCVSDGDPIPTVTWYSPNGTELVTITGTDSTIFVDINSADDFGDYRCTAYNGLGRAVEKVVSVEPIGKYNADRLIDLESGGVIPTLQMNTHTLGNSEINCYETPDQELNMQKRAYTTEYLFCGTRLVYASRSFFVIK